MQRQANMEQQAIASMNSRIQAQCKYPEEVPPRKEALSNFECKDKIFRESYLPTSSAPDLAANFAAKYRSLTVDYAEGNISKEKLKTQYALIENEYWQQLNQRYFVAQSRAIQQQQAFTGQIQTLGQTLQRQSEYNHASNQCSSLSIPPIATVGCKNVCINGQWAEVC